MATTQSETLDLTIQDDSELFEIETTAANFRKIDAWAAGTDAALDALEHTAFTVPQTLTEPQSEESRSSLFGKIAAFIRDLAAHLGTSGTHANATTGKAGYMSAADKKKLDGIEAGANNYTYTHPTFPAKSSGLYKITTNAEGHVTASEAVQKSDIEQILGGKPTYPTKPIIYKETQTFALNTNTDTFIKIKNITSIIGRETNQNVYAVAGITSDYTHYKDFAASAGITNIQGGIRLDTIIELDSPMPGGTNNSVTINVIVVAF